MLLHIILISETKQKNFEPKVLLFLNLVLLTNTAKKKMTLFKSKMLFSTYLSFINCSAIAMLAEVPTIVIIR